MSITNAQKSRLSLHHLRKILFGQCAELIDPLMNRGIFFGCNQSTSRLPRQRHWYCNCSVGSWAWIPSKSSFDAYSISLRFIIRLWSTNHVFLIQDTLMLIFFSSFALISARVTINSLGARDFVTPLRSLPKLNTLPSYFILSHNLITLSFGPSSSSVRVSWGANQDLIWRKSFLPGLVYATLRDGPHPPSSHGCKLRPRRRLG